MVVLQQVMMFMFFCVFFVGACVFVCAYIAHERSGHHTDVGEQSETRST